MHTRFVDRNQVSQNERSFAREVVISHSGDASARLNERTNERMAGTSANNIVAGPTDPDLTALTPFPALMTHRAAQLGFRANGTKSSARMGSTESRINPYVGGHAAGRTITSLALAIKRCDFLGTMIHSAA